ncbi:CGNR zinc finger domain-containing protein [Nonomuraea sp. B1E8]|uniref:CGNR zinc finger domain-containing protein n=1 Tax=unclassified Nonomuraea TaxID=2593643 RepID=UPI00325E9C17
MVRRSRGASGCDLVFFDVTRNASRRFCGVSCRNRARAGAYRGAGHVRLQGAVARPARKGPATGARVAVPGGNDQPALPPSSQACPRRPYSVGCEVEIGGVVLVEPAARGTGPPRHCPSSTHAPTPRWRG